MDKMAIDLGELKRGINALLDHVIQDLGVEKLAIQDKEDFYWECPTREMYDCSKKPSGEFYVGRLSDDLHFLLHVCSAEVTLLAC